MRGNDHTMGTCRVGDDLATRVVDRGHLWRRPSVADDPALATRLAHHSGGTSR
jgi:hypothetical protein